MCKSNNTTATCQYIGYIFIGITIILKILSCGVEVSVFDICLFWIHTNSSEVTLFYRVVWRYGVFIRALGSGMNQSENTFQLGGRRVQPTIKSYTYSAKTKNYLCTCLMIQIWLEIYSNGLFPSQCYHLTPSFMTIRQKNICRTLELPKDSSSVVGVSREWNEAWIEIWEEKRRLKEIKSEKKGQSGPSEYLLSYL